MMHGYLALDGDGELLVPFRTWRNSNTDAASSELTGLFGHNIPHRWSIAHLYQAVLDGEAELGETSTTDGTLESQGLVVLEDDKQIQPAQNLVPAVSTEFLDANPDVADVLNPLMAALTTEKLTELNGRVAVDREQPEDVARDFLESEGLLG